MKKKHKKPKQLSFTERKKIINQTADELIKRLKDVGFKIQRYDSYSSNSVYLKLDYGVSNSIRISDHKGKKHLKYRYSFLTCIPEHIPYYSSQTTEGWTQHYYQPDSIDKFLEQLKQDYFKKLDLYGPKGYRNMMDKYRIEGLTKQGFWQKAVEV